MEHLRLPALLSNLSRWTSWIRECMARDQISKGDILSIELLLEEVCTNICRYGYLSGHPIAHATPYIEVGYTCTPLKGDGEGSKKSIDLYFIDEGIPFDPMGAALPPLMDSKSLKEREEGGLGLVFIHQLIDEGKYLREGDKNILSVRRECL